MVIVYIGLILTTTFIIIVNYAIVNIKIVNATIFIISKVVKMSIYQRIKDLAQAKNITVRDAERALGYANGTFRKWENNANSQRLIEVADYFGVTTDYLLGRTKDPVKTLDQEINEALDYSVGYSGKPITDNDREIIRGMIEAYIKNKKR